LGVAFRTETMPRKNPFPPEADTKPEVRPSKGTGRQLPESAPVPRGQAGKNRKERSEAPTLPPPATAHGKGGQGDKSGKGGQGAKGAKGQDRRRSGAPRASDVRPTERMASATVDEVTADLSKDPRREPLAPLARRDRR
jgi:hypothetical protein